MIKLDEAEAASIFEILLDRLQMGEEFIITRRGTPVANLVPIKPATDRGEPEFGPGKNQSEVRR